jgi:GNAT superfamily N-acetyltransferase
MASTHPIKYETITGEVLTASHPRFIQAINLITVTRIKTENFEERRAYHQRRIEEAIRRTNATMRVAFTAQELAGVAFTYTDFANPQSELEIQLLQGEGINKPTHVMGLSVLDLYQNQGITKEFFRQIHARIDQHPDTTDGSYLFVLPAKEETEGLLTMYQRRGYQELGLVPEPLANRSLILMARHAAPQR